MEVREKTELLIQDCHTDMKNQLISFRAVCRTACPASGKKQRLSAVFQSAAAQRRYPVRAEYIGEKNGIYEYAGEVQIQAAYVFYREPPDPAVSVSMRLSCCGGDKEWVTSGVLREFPGSLFVEEKEQETLAHLSWRRIKYAFCTLLLPLWLFDGLLAVKGYKKLHPAAKDRQGKGAMLYHAHGLVQDWTGYGYSIREYKTGYFKKQYEKACRKQKKPSGILLLSERKLAPGGNLDLVRKELSRAGYEYREFLTTKPVHKLSMEQLRTSAEEIAAARLIILEDFFPQLHALSVRRETKILQLWHACGAFKLFGLSELGTVPQLEQSSANHRSYTAALASSQGIVPFYSEAFGISDAQVRPIGVPRTDIFFDMAYQGNARSRMYSEYPLCRGKRVVLFAPTFRGSGNKTAYYPEESFPLEQLLDALPGDAVVIVKHHPFVKGSLVKNIGEKYAGRVLEETGRVSINDLLFITDLLITDYSSVIFEASLLDIPMIFYAFDLEEYLQDRDLYFDYADMVPGRVVQEEDELVRAAADLLTEGAPGAAASESASPENMPGTAASGSASPGKNMPGTAASESALPENAPGAAASETASPGKNTQGKNTPEEFRRFFLGALDGHSAERTIALIREMLSENENPS